MQLRVRENQDPEWITVVPENRSRIHQWVVAADRILVSYVWQTETRVCVFDLNGGKVGEWPVRTGGRTVRFLAGSPDSDEIVVESESFTQPAATLLCRVRSNRFDLCGAAREPVPFQNATLTNRSGTTRRTGTRIPMCLVGRRDVLRGGCHPAIMTSYGGYGVPMTAQFSVFVAFLIEHGCLFALPNIRGGSEFGAEWHNAAKRRNRQTAYDDFLCAAEWLIAQRQNKTGASSPFSGDRILACWLALALTPTSRSVSRSCVPGSAARHKLRYHLIDDAQAWREEYGTAEDPDDFAALARYSPYHQVRSGVGYPATLMISGDADQKCNPCIARKMVARLQAATSGGRPVLLDYSRFRGHSPVLPLSHRIEALTDRMALLCDQLHLEV